MATPNLKLIDVLRKTAKKLQNGSNYQWGHMGSCNCGNLAQEVTMLSQAEIHEHALRTREGDWSEQTAEYCAKSGLPMDILVDKMLQIGLTTTDLQHLEKLSDKEILKRLPFEERNLQHNVRNDVVKYFSLWADMLEEQLLDSIQLPEIKEESSKVYV